MASQAVINDSIASQLLASAKITDLPDKHFFRAFTPRRRRELVYHVTAEAQGIAIELTVSGAGSMTASLIMPCVIIDDGAIDQCDQRHALSWAHSGKEARLATSLNHRHLIDIPDASTVLSAFLDAISVQRKAVCCGGYAHWTAAMQLMTNRIARERGVPIEVIAFPPMTADDHVNTRTDTTRVEICDMTDQDAPQPLRGYQDEFREIDEAMTPEAMALTLLAPGYLVKRRHKEIFHAG